MASNLQVSSGSRNDNHSESTFFPMLLPPEGDLTLQKSIHLVRALCVFPMEYAFYVTDD